MERTVFYKKDGSISSIRTATPIAGGTKYRTVYLKDRSRGGTTIKNNNGFSARFNNYGQAIGSSIKVGDRTNYYDRSGNSIVAMKGF